MFRFALPLSLLLHPLAASAEGPRVVTDLAPVQGLVALVMDGAGTPEVLLPPGADPHDFAFRPSDARTLNEADLVVWVGPAMTPWLEDPLQSLHDGPALALLETDGWEPLPLEEGDGHDHGHDHDHDHGDEAIDPHAFLDPVIAAAWLGPIAEALADLDPDHADLYRANAAAGADDLTALADEIGTTMPDSPAPYIVLHDAFGYFERRFDLAPAAALTGPESLEASPGALREVLAAAETGQTGCLLGEEGRAPTLFDRAAEATGLPVVTIPAAPADNLSPAESYPAYIRAIGAAFATCTGADEPGDN